jgi:hypothetical protein
METFFVPQRQKLSIGGGYKETFYEAVLLDFVKKNH